MNERDTSPIGFFQKYLTVWVILCMAVGICIGKFLPQIPEFLNRFEYALTFFKIEMTSSFFSTLP